MAKFLKITGITLLSAFLVTSGLTGCGGSATTSGSAEETGKLEEARAAAESAERKLSELRTERMKLEEELGTSGTQEQNEEQEQEELLQEDGSN
ncbi:MAG: hypothetical protein JW863_02975 [Chitinispirillaceae bacterium]|nr:hypothetical protein [Chitinispirillaceae bacterium]